MVLTYYNLDGKINGFDRRRHHDPLIIKGKPAKCTQPKGSPVRAYFPEKSLEKLRDSVSEIYVTEGELKGLALSKSS